MAQRWVGGQAVIEGVMMRYGNNVATAVRKKGKIMVKKQKISSLSDRIALFRLPFFRGIIALGEMLYLGTKTLMWSAKEAADEEDIELSGWQVTLTVFISMAFAIGLFVILPYAVSYLAGLDEASQPVVFNLVDGMIKVVVLLIYVYAIGLMSDVRRVFEYHGAEHKAVNMWEAKAKQTYMASRKYSTVHKRCGTNFLFIVILAGVFIFSFIPFIIQAFSPDFFSLPYIVRYPVLMLSRIMFLPLVAALAYEWLRLLGKFPDSRLMLAVSAPGLWLQRITTKEPSKEQLEVAFKALNAVVKE